MQPTRTAGILVSVALAAACNPLHQTESEVAGASSMGLSNTAWWVEDITKRGVVDYSHTTIEFHAGGRVSGDTGCNEYTGFYSATATELQVGPLSIADGDCTDALIDQERRFLAAIETVRYFHVAETGLLHLKDGNGHDVVRLSRVDR